MSEDIPVGVKREVLKGWREKHWQELDATIAVLIGIRDDVEASNKDRIEAGKAISRMLGVMAAEKVEPNRMGGIMSAPKKPELKPKHLEELESLLSEL